jgi:hypothetical protein
VYANGNSLSRVDPSGLFSVAPAVIEQALARAGLAEAAGLGPEDPLADVAAAIAIVGTIVLASDPPASPAASTASGSCPPKDPCAGLCFRLKEHEQKLTDYINNPLAEDANSRGILGQAYLYNEGARAISIYDATRAFKANNKLQETS